MSGICGVVHSDLDFRFDRARLRNMRDSMACRGPDGWGEHVAGRAALASRRLSLLDPGERGRTPLTSHDGRYVIVCDGAVLNHSSLRAGLDPPPGGFRTKTDAEVLLHLYARRGPAMLEALNGAFAFAIWDNMRGELFLARDRLGVKPLCYALRGGAFYFASEEKALFAAGIASELDESCWPELMVFRYVAGERTPYRGVSRLLPGHYLVWKGGEFRVKPWWRLGERVMALRESLPAHPPQWLAGILSDTVRLCRTGEVPVGLLLSGGLCSAALAACLAADGAVGLASFTARFDQPARDGGGRAQMVADLCDLDYHELPLAAEEVIGLVEPATWLDDLPLAHGFETQLLGVSEYANCRVRVLLSGTGGHEMLGGYARYWPLRRPFTLTPSRAAPPRTAGLTRLNGSAGRLIRWLAPCSSERRAMFNGCDVLPPEVEALGVLCREFPFREQVLAEALRVYPGEPMRQAMYLDQHTYIPSLADRADRMTAGASVECRLPFLDHRLVEGLAALPSSVLLGPDRANSLLRQAMEGRLPERIGRGRKWGSEIPWRRYLRGVPALRRLVEQLPRADAVRNGPFKPAPVADLVASFLQGDDGAEPMIRQLLMVTIWHQTCVKSASLRCRAARAGGIYL